MSSVADDTDPVLIVFVLSLSPGGQLLSRSLFGPLGLHPGHPGRSGRRYLGNASIRPCQQAGCPVAAGCQGRWGGVSVGGGALTSTTLTHLYSQLCSDTLFVHSDHRSADVSVTSWRLVSSSPSVTSCVILSSHIYKFSFLSSSSSIESFRIQCSSSSLHPSSSTSTSKWERRRMLLSSSHLHLVTWIPPPPSVIMVTEKVCVPQYVSTGLCFWGRGVSEQEENKHGDSVVKPQTEAQRFYEIMCYGLTEFVMYNMWTWCQHQPLL